MRRELPELKQVVITHYQCQDFSLGTTIFSMQLYAGDKAIEFKDPDEARMIKAFCERVNLLQQEGLQVVHWSQNRPHFGPDHIRSRYRELTGMDINLDYTQSLNLSDWLKERYGEDYLPQDARLDQLAHLNRLLGSRKTEGPESRIFGTNRLLLIKSIFSRARQDSLITTEKYSAPSATGQSAKMIQLSESTKSFSSYLSHDQPDLLAEALRKEFGIEKGKTMRLLIEVLCRQNLLKLCSGRHKQLYTAMTTWFARPLGSYNGIFGYKIADTLDKDDMEALKHRVLKILDKFPTRH